MNPRLIDFGGCLIDPAKIVRVSRGGTSGNSLIYVSGGRDWFSFGGEAVECVSATLGYDAVRDILDKLGIIRHDFDPVVANPERPQS